MGLIFPFKKSSSAELIGPVWPEPLEPNLAENSNSKPRETEVLSNEEEEP